VTVTLSGTTRELACLALGHEDADEPRCSTSDEDLVRQLVDEVQALRVAAGIVEPTEADRAAATGALDEALGDALARFVTGPELSEVVLRQLAEHGWQLLPVRRP
jgi:hypothetical protein